MCEEVILDTASVLAPGFCDFVSHALLLAICKLVLIL